MKVDPNSIIRLRDLNQVQQDILKIIYRHIKDAPKSPKWEKFDKMITYQNRRFRVQLTYRVNDFFLEIQKFDHYEDGERSEKSRFIHWSKGEKW